MTVPRWVQTLKIYYLSYTKTYQRKCHKQSKTVFHPCFRYSFRRFSTSQQPMIWGVLFGCCQISNQRRRNARQRAKRGTLPIWKSYFRFWLFKFMTSSDTHACIARLLRKKVPTGTEFSSLFQLAHMQYQNAIFKKWKNAWDGIFFFLSLRPLAFVDHLRKYSVSKSTRFLCDVH